VQSALIVAAAVGDRPGLKHREKAARLDFQPTAGSLARLI
jgi:hypothetical protein